MSCMFTTSLPTSVLWMQTLTYANSRGKKIFRRFEDRTNGDDIDATSSVAPSISDVSGTPEQRRLKRQAGAAAQRPLTRSAIKPRLLFPSEEQIREREERDAIATAYDEEEAVTDIEMTNADAEDEATTPVATNSLEVSPATPPSTTSAKKGGKRAGGSGRKKSASTSPRKRSLPEIVEEAAEALDDSQLPADDAQTSFSSISTGTSPAKRTRASKSPFDSWQRTKAQLKLETGVGSSKKRAGEPLAGLEEGAGGKRTRSAVSSGSPMA